MGLAGRNMVVMAIVTLVVGGCGTGGDPDPEPEPFWTYAGDGVGVTARLLAELEPRDLSVEELGVPLLAAQNLAMLGSATHRGDDGFLVLERQPPSVWVVDGSGESVARLGRSGDGPGELRDPSAVEWTNDGQIMILDARRQAFVYLGPGGDELGRTPLPPSSPPFMGFTMVGLDQLGGVIGVREEEMRFRIEDGFQYRPGLRVVRIPDGGDAEVILAEAPSAGRTVRELFPGQLASAPTPGGPDTRVSVSEPCGVFAFSTESRVLARFDFSDLVEHREACDGEQVDVWILTSPNFLSDYASEGHLLYRIEGGTLRAIDAVRLPPKASVLSIRNSEAIVILNDSLDVPTVWSMDLSGRGG